MIVLSTTSDVVRLGRSSANSVHVHATFVDHTTANYTPGRQNATFAAAATSTIVASPAASTQRSVKFISILAQGGANTVTVDFFDGATQFVLEAVSLNAGDSLTYTDTDGWRVIDSSGQLKTVAAGGGGGGGGISLAAGTQTATSGTVVLSNSNGVVFGMSGSTRITASVDPQIGLVSHVGGNSQSNVTRLAFSNASGVTFSLSTAASAATLLASIASSLTNINVSAGTTSNNLSALVFSNSNGVSFGLNGSTVTASAAGGGGGGGIAASASVFGGSISNGTLVFSNDTIYTQFSSAVSSQNVLFSINGSTLIASALVAFGDTAGPFVGSRLDLLNSNGVSFGMDSTTTNGGRLVRATASFEPRIGIVSHVGGNVVSSVTRLAFSNASNVTFSLSTAANAATVIASVAAGGGGGGVTLSGWDPYREAIHDVASFPASNTLQLTVNPVEFPLAVQFDRLVFPVNFSLTTSTHSGTIRYNVGIYTRNVSTLSLLHSTTFTLGITVSTGNTSLFQGPGLLTIPWTSTISAGQYWLAVALGSTSAGANASISWYRSSQVSSSQSRIFGASSNNTIQPVIGFGVHSASSSALPASLAFSHINGASSVFRRPPVFHFASQSA